MQILADKYVGARKAEVLKYRHHVFEASIDPVYLPTYMTHS